MNIFISCYLVIGVVIGGWLFTDHQMVKLFDAEELGEVTTGELALFYMLALATIIAFVVGWPITLWGYWEDE